jgi:hypothetical protein
MNLMLNVWLVVAISVSNSLIHASAPSLVGFQSVHEINEKLQKLKQKHEQIGKQIIKNQNELDLIIRSNKTNKELSDRLAELVHSFNIIEKIESQKMDELDKLILKDNFSERNDHVKKRRLEKINKLNDLITRQYNIALLSYFGSYGSGTKAVNAKIKIHEDMMAQYEIGRDIKRNIELYKLMTSLSRSNQRAEGIESMSYDGESSQQIDNDCSTLETSKTYSK